MLQRLSRQFHLLPRQLLLNCSRFCSGQKGDEEIAPPWAMEKLLMDGHSLEDIKKKGWKKLIDLEPDQSFLSVDNRVKMQHFELSFEYFQEQRKKKQLDALMNDQKRSEVRERDYGAELSAAGFLLQRNALVKFHGLPGWISKKEAESMSATIDRKSVVEAIDMRDFGIIRRGFDNLMNLKDLRSLKVAKLTTIDDFCMDAISGYFCESLEYLDISGCPNVTERGLGVLHRCQNLKAVYMIDTPNVKNKELVTILLEDVLPECQFIGVDYWQTEKKE